MNYNTVDENGRPMHKCEDVGPWDEIYCKPDGEWVLNYNAGDAKFEIKFCPWCGEKLSIVR